MSVSFSGFDSLADALEEIADTVDDELPQAASDGMDVVLEDASRRAPVDPDNPGDLAGSMTQEVSERERDSVEVIGGPDRDHFYGMFVELGTKHIPADPFLRPAIDTQKEQALAAMSKRLQKAIGGVI